MGNANVLVVEDDDSIRSLLVEGLRTHDVKVDGARDGVEALHQIVTNHYSVMILDLMMPKMSGVDLLDSLEALLSDPSVQSLDNPPAVLVITGVTRAALPDDNIIRRCPGLVHGIFRKPLDISEVSASVGKHLRA